MSTPGIGGAGQTPQPSQQQGVKGKAQEFSSKGGATLGGLKAYFIQKWGKKDGTKAFYMILKTMEMSAYNQWKQESARVKAAEKRMGQSSK